MSCSAQSGHSWVREPMEDAQSGDCSYMARRPVRGGLTDYGRAPRRRWPDGRPRRTPGGCSEVAAELVQVAADN